MQNELLVELYTARKMLIVDSYYLLTRKIGSVVHSGIIY